MAHSLFEPAPEPLSEKLWRHVKSLKQTPFAGSHFPVRQTDMQNLDARGRQLLLEEAFAAQKK
ncbi:hypothetical protein [Labrenzia sp. PHM005]|uniref:hypothetical protein n=1 Tax=Labrenzia sp. PHM005 TaxID=2590016 RepID=UPI00113FCD3B|nr:hypothetical protein [Labrenzia sp. PHM005]QDG75069.1 hypothetical protein FJ695_03880 [Labrenzia sp. PHM005]